MSYESLFDRAKELLPIVDSQARRPYVVEVSGTPKAGKTTGIAMLASFFRQAGWKVQVIEERAAVCPIAMKGHFFFNTWTTCTMIAELVANAASDAHLVILDRGLFDALIWLRLQEARGQVTPEELAVFTQFVSLDRWRELQDASFLLEVEPDVALRREDAGHLVPRRGSLMSEDALTQLNEVIGEAAREHGERFGLVQVPAGGDDHKAIVGAIATQLIDRVREWADPLVAVVDRSRAQALFGEAEALAWEDGGAWGQLEPHVRLETRSTVEPRNDVVQIIAAAIHTRDSGVFVFDRREGPKRKRYGRSTLWKGSHVRRVAGRVTIADLESCLLQRLREDLHFQGLHVDLKPLGLVWTPKQRDEERHLGVVFKAPIENDLVAEHLMEKSFRAQGRVPPLTMKAESPAELRKRAGEFDLEPWSRQILEAGWLT